MSSLPPPVALLTPSAALLAGVVASFHCAGMCGPLACAILPWNRDSACITASAYHIARITAYGCLGAIAGGLGRLPLSLMPASVLMYAPILTALAFLGLALRWDTVWGRPFKAGTRVFGKVRKLGIHSPWSAGLLLGAATPLLPCGPLYFLIAVSLLSGSSARGAELMICFGIGTLPLLWLAQSQFARLQARLSPRWLSRIRVSLALVAAVVAAWRARYAAASSTTPYVCF